MATSIANTSILLTGDATSINTFTINTSYIDDLVVGMTGYLTANNIKSLEVTITNLDLATGTVTVIPSTNNYVWSSNSAPAITDYKTTNNSIFVIPAQTVAGLPSGTVPTRFKVDTETSELQGAGNENEIQVKIGSPTAISDGKLLSIVNGSNEVASVEVVNGVTLINGSLASDKVISVESFGVVGDGTDETANIQLALNAAITNNYVLYFPPAPVCYGVKNLLITSPVVIKGDGVNSILRLPVLASMDGSPILNITTGGVEIKGLVFQGQRSLQPADGWSDSYGTLTTPGRSFRAAIRAYSASSHIGGLLVEDCKFSDNQGASIATLNFYEVQVLNNVFENNSQEGVFLYSDGSGSFLYGHKVIGNLISNHHTGDSIVNCDAIILSHAEKGIVSNNNVYSVDRDGVKLEASKNIIIKDNILDTNLIGNYASIQLQTFAENIEISSNLIKNFGAGIQLNITTTCKNIKITENTIDGTVGPVTGDGIQSDAVVGYENIIVSNNVIRDTQRYGINLAGEFNGLTVLANRVDGGTAGIVLTSGAGNITGLVCSNNNVISSGTSVGGVRLQSAGGFHILDAVFSDNTAIVGANNPGIVDATGAISGGVVSGNYTDGYGSFGNRGISVDDSNVFETGCAAAGMRSVVLVTPHQILDTDTIVAVKLTTPGPSSITLPAYGTSLAGKIYTVKDEKGDAFVNPISIYPTGGTLDGGSGPVIINTNYGFKKFYSDGVNWFTVSFSDDYLIPTSKTAAAISALISAIGSRVCTIKLSRGAWTIESPITFPSNITVKIESGAVLTKSSTGTLRIDGPIDFPLAQIFSGFALGEVVFAGGGIISRPEWWGAVSDGATDCAFAIQAAIDSFALAPYPKSGRIQLSGGTYRITKTIHLGYGGPNIGQITSFKHLELVGVGPQTAAEPYYAGTCIFADFSTGMGINIQGLRDAYLADFVIKGANLDWLYYDNVAPVGMSRNLGGPGTLDPADPDSWIDPALLTANPNADSVTAPYAGIAFDGYAGVAPAIPYPTVSYPAVLGTVTQYDKSASSSVLFERIKICGFVVGMVTQPNNNSDRNADFVSFFKCRVENNKYGISISHTQCRNLNIADSNLAFNYIALTNNTHGRQFGFMHGHITGTSFDDCWQMLKIGTSKSGPMVFESCYAETLGWIGTTGTVGASGEHVSFIGCHFDFGNEDNNSTPANYYESSTVASTSFINTTLLVARVFTYVGDVTFENSYVYTVSSGMFDSTVSGRLGYNACSGHIPGGGLSGYTNPSWRHRVDGRIKALKYSNVDSSTARVSFIENLNDSLRTFANNSRSFPPSIWVPKAVLPVENLDFWTPGVLWNKSSFNFSPSSIVGLDYTLDVTGLNLTANGYADTNGAIWLGIGDILHDWETDTRWFVLSRSANIVVLRQINNIEWISAGVFAPWQAISAAGSYITIYCSRIYAQPKATFGDATLGSDTLVNCGDLRDVSFLYNVAQVGDHLLSSSLDCGPHMSPVFGKPPKILAIDPVLRTIRLDSNALRTQNGVPINFFIRPSGI